MISRPPTGGKLRFGKCLAPARGAGACNKRARLARPLPARVRGGEKPAPGLRRLSVTPETEASPAENGGTSYAPALGGSKRGGAGPQNGDLRFLRATMRKVPTTRAVSARMIRT